MNYKTQIESLLRAEERLRSELTSEIDRVESKEKFVKLVNYLF